MEKKKYLVALKIATANEKELSPFILLPWSFGNICKAL